LSNPPLERGPSTQVPACSADGLLKQQKLLSFLKGVQDDCEKVNIFSQSA
jgi:hypothetical protein